MNYITFYEKYRKASPDGGEYTYCIPEQSNESFPDSNR